MTKSQPPDEERRGGPIHQRPRLGGDGQLWLPLPVVVERDGSVRTRQSERAYDPFEPTFDGLLLAESFARLAIHDHHALHRWVLEHGALDRTGFWEDPSPNYPPRRMREAIDHQTDLATEQATVRWLLRTLATVSQHRLDGEWDAAWSSSAGPLVGVPDAVAADTVGAGLEAASSWADAVDRARRVLTPYVTKAVERTFLIEAEQQESAHGPRPVLTPREWRIWGSILAPMSLQLFESLRRITEGEPGAAICQECREPFLMNDARRRLYCNERHRHRYTERRRRRRLALERAKAASGGDETT